MPKKIILLRTTSKKKIYLNRSHRRSSIRMRISSRLRKNLRYKITDFLPTIFLPGIRITPLILPTTCTPFPTSGLIDNLWLSIRSINTMNLFILLNPSKRQQYSHIITFEISGLLPSTRRSSVKLLEFDPFNISVIVAIYAVHQVVHLPVDISFQLMLCHLLVF